MKKFLIIPLLAASLYVFIQYFSKPDLSQEVAAFNAGLAGDMESVLDPTASLPGKEMRYEDSQKLPLNKQDFLGRSQSKSRYIAQSAKPMLKNNLSVNLEDMGVASDRSGKNPLAQVGRGKELDGYRPSTEQELLSEAARQARKKKAPGKGKSADIRKFQSRGGGAISQLKTASRMGAVALEAKDEDAQLLLSRAFVTGEDPQKALDKVRREGEGSGTKSALISSLAGAVIGFLNPGGVFNWSSLISKKTVVTTSYESMNQAKACEVCGTVSWDAVLAGPQTVGESAPSRASPYSVELDPKKAPMSLSIQDIQ